MQNQIKYVKFNNHAIFNNEILPILEHLTSLLRHNDMPYFFAAAIKSDETGTEYAFESHDNWATDAKMRDDKIPDFIKVVNGFKTMLPDGMIEVEL